MDEPGPAEETKDIAQTDFAFDVQQPTESYFMNEIRDPLEKEEVLETSPAEETKDIAQTNFSFDGQHSSESDFINEMRDLHEKEEEVETGPAEETKDIAQTDFAFDGWQPTESGFMNEIRDLHEKEEVVEPRSAEETKDIAQTDFAIDVQQPTESDFMNEIRDLHEKEEEVETGPAEETKDIAQTDFAFDGRQPTESGFMNEIRDLHDKEEEVEPRSAEETKDIAQTDFAIDVQQPTESDFMNEIKDLHDKEEEVEPGPAKEMKDIAQTDFAFDEQNPSESDFMNEMKDFLENEEMGESNPNDDTSGFKDGQGKVCFMTKKSPFSIHVEIDDFLHAPICGDIVQNTFEFLDLNNKQTPEFDTKLLTTTTYYPEQPDCRLVCSKIHEIVFLTNDPNEGKNNKGNHFKSVVVPLHDSLFTKAEESNNHSYVHIRVPVLLGEYNIEICLEENVTFKEDVMRIREISKEVVLTNFRLVPTLLSQYLNSGMRTVLKGNLFIEGHIYQKIEYTSIPKRNTESVIPLTQLYQKMVVELIIHILQVQQVVIP